MHPGIFLGLALFSGIFLLAGNGAHMFMLYTIGLSSMGGFIFLTGLAIPKRADWINLSFQTQKNFPTIIVKGLILIGGTAMLFSSINYWRDVPLYKNENYSIISGKPSLVEEYTSKNGGEDIYITINGEYIDLIPDPIYEDPQELKEKHFTIRYLPHSKWVIDYEME